MICKQENNYAKIYFYASIVDECVSCCSHIKYMMLSIFF